MKKALIIVFVILLLSAVMVYFYGTDQVEEPIEEPIAKECFIGGCSRELCTDDPEAISTCEFLPGMECLVEEMSCESVAGECAWVLSEEAARCFMNVLEEQGEEVRETRIGNLFEKAKEILQ